MQESDNGGDTVFNVSIHHVMQFTIIVTGPAKTGHICTNYTCSENGTFLDPHV